VNLKRWEKISWVLFVVSIVPMLTTRFLEPGFLRTLLWVLSGLAWAAMFIGRLTYNWCSVCKQFVSKRVRGKTLQYCPLCGRLLHDVQWGGD
jgi:hypothetical protein